MPTQQDKYSDPALATQSAYMPGTTMGQGPERLDVRNEGLEAENRSKLEASGELPSGAPPELAQEQVFQATYGIGNPKFGSPVISSAAAGAEMDTAARDAQNGLSATVKTPEYQQYVDMQGELDSTRNNYKGLKDQVLETIEKDYALRTADQKDANRLTTGANAAALARMGALGTSVSGLDYMKEVDLQNQRELTKITVEKSKALIGALDAYYARDWEVVKEKMSESKKLTDQYNNIQKWMFEDTMKTREERMDQVRFGWEKEDRAMKRIADLGASGMEYDKLDPKEIAMMEQMANVPTGFFKAWFDTNKELADVELGNASIDQQKKIVDLLNAVPEGQSVQIGNDIYKGWKKAAANNWETTVTDQYGNVTFVTYDPETKQIQKIGLGSIGTPQQGWSTVQTTDGLFWVNNGLQEVRPVMTKGGEIDASVYPGFADYAEGMGTITTRFGDPGGFEKFHPGWDIAGPVGTPVTAFKGGTVTKIDNVGLTGFGKFVEVTDSEGKVWRYSHMDSVNLQEGQTLKDRQFIGGMGNTGSSKTSDGAGGWRVPTDEERASGRGSHLDLRVFGQGTQLSGDTKSTIPGVTNADSSQISSDIEKVRSLQDPVAKRENYLKIKANVAQMGDGALTWFAKAFPEGDVIGKESNLPKLGEITDMDKYSYEDVLSIVKRDTLGWDQVSAKLGDMKTFTSKQVIDLGVASSATQSQVKAILKKGPFFMDKWDDETKKYFEKQFK